MLAGYHGYLVADAHVVYDHLYESGEVVEVNCWAHCRRYFFKALASDPDRAKVALGLIGALFRICCRARWLMGARAGCVMGITPGARMHARRDGRFLDRRCRFQGAAPRKVSV